MRKMMIVGPKAGQTIAEFSRQFQYEFVTLLRTRHNTMRVRANAVYNEYIQDKNHVHMNATRWVTLSGFVMTLGKAGIVKVDEDEQGLWITWVDNSPKTLAKQVSYCLTLDCAELTLRLPCRSVIGLRWMEKRGSGRFWRSRLLGLEPRSRSRTRQTKASRKRRGRRSHSASTRHL